MDPQISNFKFTNISLSELNTLNTNQYFGMLMKRYPLSGITIPRLRPVAVLCPLSYHGFITKRTFQTTLSTRLNPMMPFDPTEVLSDDPGEDENGNKKKGEKEDKWADIKSTLSKCLETALITFSSLLVLGLSGIAYHEIYYSKVLNKIEDSFDQGDPSTLEQRHKVLSKDTRFWVERENQRILDEIFGGDIQGRYFLIIGEKGTGKTSAIMESMRRVNGGDCAIVDCSSDLELMRLRIGDALNFRFHEDYIGSLFSIRGPRDTTALLDIERAFVKLEEVANRKVKETKKPLVLVLNNAHLIKNDEDGAALVELLQQKAEMLASAGLVTMIFNSDDYWLYERFKQLATRLEILNFKDLHRDEAINALRASRARYFGENLEDDVCKQVYELVGGRPQHINHVAAHQDMIKACNDIIDKEKIWFLNQCGLLGEDMDDDVMESGKFSTSAMLLMRELVEMDRQRLKQLNAEGNGETISKEHVLPELPLWRARQVMTRPDYIQGYDHLNIFTIDSYSMVRADSVPMMRAFHEISSQPGFDQLLEETVDRVSAIESLGRTKELVFKDLMLGGKFHFEKTGNEKKNWAMTLHGGTKETDEEDKNDEELMKLDEIHEGARKKWWKKRMQNYSYVPAVGEEGEERHDEPIDLSREKKL